MIQNHEKYTIIFKELFKDGWRFYRRPNSSIFWWVDPKEPTKDYRIKDAYIKAKGDLIHA